MSKFDSFFDAATPVPTEAASKTAKKKATAKASAPEKRMAKRDDPDYRQALAYIKSDTHRRVKVALAEDGREFSDLVDGLLNQWLERRGK